MSIGWGFIGASIWARAWMIPAVQAVEGGRAVGVFSSSPERGEQLAREAGLERVYPSLDALLADPLIDAVYVSTTNDRHAEPTIAAARAGKHVLCKKPIALSLDDAMAMRQAGADAGVVIATNHHLRGAATILAMKDLLAQGAIGDVVAARIANTTLLPEAMRTCRLHQRQSGAGVILDLTVHLVDTIRFLLSDEVGEVTAVTTNQGMGSDSVEDSAIGVLRMRGGQLVGFHDAFTVPHAGTGLEVHGTTGSLLGRDVMGPTPGGDLLLRRLDDVEPVEVADPWPLYENAIRHFNAAIGGHGHPLASIDDGIASLAVALAALASSRDGRPVALSEVAPS